MKTIVFSTYKKPIQSFSEGNEKFLGVLEPGRIRGFDTLFVQSGLNFGLSHSLTGIIKTRLDETQTSPRTGVILSRQGAIVHIEGDVSDLSVMENTGNEDREDSIYFDINFLESSDSINEGVFGVLPGGEELTNTMVLIGKILVRPGATTISAEDFTPARTYGIGGFKTLSEYEITTLVDTLTSAMVDVISEQTITGKKTFSEGVSVTGGSIPNTLDIFKSLNTKRIYHSPDYGLGNSDWKLKLLSWAKTLDTPVQGEISVDVLPYGTQSGDAVGVTKFKIILNYTGTSKPTGSYMAYITDVSGDTYPMNNAASWLYEDGLKAQGTNWIVMIPMPAKCDFVITYNLRTYIDITPYPAPINLYMVPWASTIAPILIDGRSAQAKRLDLSSCIEAWNGNGTLLQPNWRGFLLPVDPVTDYYTVVTSSEDPDDILFLVGFSHLSSIPTGKEITLRFSSGLVEKQEEGSIASKSGFGILDFLSLGDGVVLGGYTLASLKSKGLRLTRQYTASGGFNRSLSHPEETSGPSLDSSTLQGDMLGVSRVVKLDPTRLMSLPYKTELEEAGQYLHNLQITFRYDGWSWVESSRTIWN